MQWNRTLAKITLIFGLLSLLTACGFQLRGDLDIDDSLREVSLVTGPASPELIKSLRNQMKINGISETSEAPYTIQIKEHNYKRKSATISNADVDEYELSLTVTMLVIDQQGTPLRSAIRVQRERLYDYDKNAETASNAQEKQIRLELIDAVAQGMLRRFLALKTAN